MVLIQQLLCTDKALHHEQSPTEVDNTIFLQDQRPLCFHNILLPIHYFPVLHPSKHFGMHMQNREGEITINACFEITILSTSVLLSSSYTTIAGY